MVGKKFNVTFTESKRVNPVTRTVLVENVQDEFHARNVIASQFGSFTFNKQLGMQIPSDKKIKIGEVVEVKEEIKETVEV